RRRFCRTTPATSSVWPSCGSGCHGRRAANGHTTRGGSPLRDAESAIPSGRDGRALAPGRLAGFAREIGRHELWTWWTAFWVWRLVSTARAIRPVGRLRLQQPAHHAGGGIAGLRRLPAHVRAVAAAPHTWGKHTLGGLV